VAVRKEQQESRQAAQNLAVMRVSRGVAGYVVICAVFCNGRQKKICSSIVPSIEVAVQAGDGR